MAPCLVKDMVDGSSSHACGNISVGDILTSVDGMPVRAFSCPTHENATMPSMAAVSHSLRPALRLQSFCH